MGGQLTPSVQVSQRSGNYQKGILSYPAAYVRNVQGREGGIRISVTAVAGAREFEYDTNLCPSWQTERQKDYGADQLSMRYRYKKPFRYRLTNPPKALLNARLDNIAIVPASMLPLTKVLKEKVNTLPQGAVFLCYAEENPRQRKILERVGETFREQGHVVRSQSMEEVYTHASKSGY
jgi:hypothetical protein